MAYIYVKHTIWEKITIHPGDEAKLEGVGRNDFDWSDLTNNADFEWDSDTSEYMPPEENGGQATVEIYDNDNKVVWTNADKRIKRKEKIDKII